jgi:hypothetical protein
MATVTREARLNYLILYKEDGDETPTLRKRRVRHRLRSTPMKNYGNSCYANALLHCMQPYATGWVKGENARKSGSIAAKALATMLKRMVPDQSTQPATSCEDLHKRITGPTKTTEERFRVGIQCDPSSLLLHLLEQIPELDDLTTFTKLDCQQCNTCGRNRESLTAEVNISSPESIMWLTPDPKATAEQTTQSLLDLELSPTTVEGYGCLFAISSQGRSCQAGQGPYDKFKCTYGEILGEYMIDTRDREEVINSIGNLAMHDGILTRANLATTRAGAWFDGQVLNSYFEILQRRDTKMYHNKITTHRSLFVPDHFVTRLCDSKKKPKDAVDITIKSFSKLMRHAQIHNIDELSNIQMPYHNSGNHWCDISVEPPKISFLDPLWTKGRRQGYEDAAERLKLFLCRIWDEIPKQDWEVSMGTSYMIEEREYDVPQQLGGVDCGAFTAMFADARSIHQQINFTRDDIQFFREKILLTILTSGVDIPCLTPRQCPSKSLILESIEQSKDRIDAAAKVFFFCPDKQWPQTSNPYKGDVKTKLRPINHGTLTTISWFSVHGCYRVS